MVSILASVLLLKNEGNKLIGNVRTRGWKGLFSGMEDLWVCGAFLEWCYCGLFGQLGDIALCSRRCRKERAGDFITPRMRFTIICAYSIVRQWTYRAASSATGHNNTRIVSFTFIRLQQQINPNSAVTCEQEGHIVKHVRERIWVDEDGNSNDYMER
jgi:hypothetical protein